MAQLRRAGRGLVDVVLPPRCLACGEIVEQPDALCGRCWSSITFFAPPWCAVCGLPFPHPVGDAAVCADCAEANMHGIGPERYFVTTKAVVTWCWGSSMRIGPMLRALSAVG